MSTQSFYFPLYPTATLLDEETDLLPMLLQVDTWIHAYNIFCRFPNVPYIPSFFSRFLIFFWNVWPSFQHIFTCSSIFSGIALDMGLFYTFSNFLCSTYQYQHCSSCRARQFTLDKTILNLVYFKVQIAKIMTQFISSHAGSSSYYWSK